MKRHEKLDYLQKNHMKEWLKAREEADKELSDKCEMICLCGRLCTGLHEKTCRRFRDGVDNLALEKLNHLLEQKA